MMLTMDGISFVGLHMCAWAYHWGLSSRFLRIFLLTDEMSAFNNTELAQRTFLISFSLEVAAYKLLII